MSTCCTSQREVSSREIRSSRIELKELGRPGTELGVHTQTIDLATRLDTLKQFWWQTPSPHDDFTVDLLGGAFVVRDRLTRTNPKPSKLTPAQLTNMTQAEASQMALRHRDAWTGVDHDTLAAWLRGSSAMLIARWRMAYTSGGGK